MSEFSRPGRKPDKYRASRPCMQSSRKSSKILESGWKWIENALSGLRIGQNEPQDHDESNGTPPDPKYRSRKFKIPLKSEISEIQKCPLNLATNRKSTSACNGLLRNAIIFYVMPWSALACHSQLWHVIACHSLPWRANPDAYYARNMVGADPIFIQD